MDNPDATTNDSKAGGAESLMAELYPSVRQLAHKLLWGHQQLTLQPTEFVHSLYLKFQSSSAVSKDISEQHFMALSARMLRQIVSDHVRARSSQKRGGDLVAAQLTLDGLAGEGAAQLDFMAVDEALRELSEIDPIAVSVVELKVFAGQNAEEIAEHLDTSRSTVTRKWSMAKAWLSKHL